MADDEMTFPVTVHFACDVRRMPAGVFLARCQALQLAVIRPTADDARAHLEAAIEEFVQAFVRTVAVTTNTELHEVYGALAAALTARERTH